VRSPAVTTESRPAGLFRWPQSRRGQPFVDMRGRFSLPRFAQQFIALLTERHRRRARTRQLRLANEALLQRGGVSRPSSHDMISSQQASGTINLPLAAYNQACLSRPSGASQLFAVLKGTKSRVMRSDSNSRCADISARRAGLRPSASPMSPGPRLPRFCFPPSADRTKHLVFGRNWQLVASMSAASCPLVAQEPTTCTEQPAPRQRRQR